MFKRLLKFINQPTLFGEIMRFVLVGGLATVIDFLTMGITLYCFNPSLYPNFFNVFIGGGTPSDLAAIVGTGLGFLLGLLANYVLSVIFVFNEKGKSKSAMGFIKFTIFSAIGLGIHELGMFLMFTKLGVNEWVVKIIFTIVVLVYNYITRRLFIFKKETSTDNAPNASDNEIATDVSNETNAENDNK